MKTMRGRWIRLPFTSLVLAGFMGVIGGCSESHSQGSPVYYPLPAEEAPRSVGTVASDTLLLARIKSKLFSDELVSDNGIDIKVRHGVVFLQGRVADRYQARMLIDLIRGVDGVARVEDRLTAVHSGTTFIVK